MCAWYISTVLCLCMRMAVSWVLFLCAHVYAGGGCVCVCVKCPTLYLPCKSMSFWEVQSIALWRWGLGLAPKLLSGFFFNPSHVCVRQQKMVLSLRGVPFTFAILRLKLPGPLSEGGYCLMTFGVSCPIVFFLRASPFPLNCYNLKDTFKCMHT